MQIFSYEAQPIAACSGPSGSAAVSMIRMSGKGCIDLLRQCLKHQPQLTPRQMTFVRFIDPSSDQVIDEGMAVSYEGPFSYTGEDSCELFVHGGSYIIKRVLEILWSKGFYPAQPGEFTQRAFLNGKIDLTKAEGIRELISCSTQSHWMAARQLATGRLQQLIENLRSELIKGMAFLEAQIDFPDEKETDQLRFEDVKRPILKVKAHIHQLLETYHSGQIAQNGFKIAIIGPPNAGKSSLLNALLKKERAIVSSEPGTTRDYLEESCLIDGRKFVFIDTAGLRQEANAVEKIGIERSFQMAAQSDGVIFLWPADQSRASEAAWERESFLSSFDTFSKDVSVIKALSKSDLPLSEKQYHIEENEEKISFCCFNEASLNSLKKKLCDLFDAKIHEISDKTFITTERHYHCLIEAGKSLEKFLILCDQNAYEEMLAFELQQACLSLGALIGDVHVDDLLDVVFSTFCIGK